MSIDLQFQIRQNGMDIRNYIQDLHNWEGESKPQTKKQIKEDIEFPIRGKVENDENENKQNFLRDKSNMKDYYNAWDNVDVVIKI